jgi:ParB-like chromosome segregation protein Spo0J
MVAILERSGSHAAPSAADDSRDDGVAGADAPGKDGESSSDVAPCSVWALGLAADAVGPVEWWPPKRLKAYAPRHVTLPSFRGTPSWAILQHLVKESGVREPLLILPDGRVVDGVHRLELAKALGLAEVPVRMLMVPRPLREEDRLQLEATLAVLAIGRRHIAPSRVQGLLLGLTQGELAAGVLNRRAANLRRGRAPAPGPQGPTQRALAASTGLGERTVRRLVRIGREGPEDLRRAVASGDVSVKEADRRLSAAGMGPSPSGPLILRALPAATCDRADPKGSANREEPRSKTVMTRGVGRPPAAVNPTLEPLGHSAGPASLPTPASPPLPAAVQAFLAVCHELEAATERFRSDTATWTGERRAQRRLTIRQTVEHLSEQLEWMQADRGDPS